MSRVNVCVCAICSFVCLWWGSYTWKWLGKISDKFEQINIAMLTNWVVILGWETFDLHRIFEGHQSDPLGTTKRCLVCNSVNLIKKTNKSLIVHVTLLRYPYKHLQWNMFCLKIDMFTQKGEENDPVWRHHNLSKWIGQQTPPFSLYNSKMNSLPFFFSKLTFPRSGGRKKKLPRRTTEIYFQWALWRS